MTEPEVTAWDKKILDAILAPKRVLFVDDDQDDLDAALRACRGFHVIPSTCKTAQEGFDLMASQPPPDFVFCDVRLPTDTHSIDLILRVNDARFPSRLVMMSFDSATFSQLEERYSLGVISFLRKRGDLTDCFRNALRQIGARETERT